MALDPATHDEVVRIAEAAGLRAAREVLKAAPTTGLLTQPSWVPATVSGDTDPGDNATVRVDGDTDPLTGGALNGTGSVVADGTRVLVLVRPNGGAVIQGRLDAPAVDPELGWVMIEHRTVSGAASVSFTPPTSGYVDLRFRHRVKSNQAADQAVNISYNGDTTTANYFRQLLVSLAGTPTGASAASRNAWNATGTAATDRVGVGETIVYDYLSAADDKQSLTMMFAQSSTGIAGVVGIVWFQGNSHNPITTVTFTPAAGTLTGTVTMEAFAVA